MNTLNNLLAMAPSGSVVLNRHLVAFTRSLEGGLLLGQLLYWTPRAKIAGGWIAKTDKEFRQELCLSRHAIRSAVKKLSKMGIIEVDVRRFNGSPTNHYRIRGEALTELWEKYVAPELFQADPEIPDCSDSDNGKSKNGQSNVRDRTMENPNPDSPLSENGQSLTKTTAETTSSSPASAPRAGKKARKEPKDTTKFHRHFMAGWKQRYGADYYWLGGQDGKNAQRILAAFGGNLGRAMAAADAFLASDDAFYVKGGHKLGLLFSNINTYLGQKEAPLDEQLLVGGRQWKGVDASDEDLIALGLATPDQLKMPVKDERKKAEGRAA